MGGGRNIALCALAISGLMSVDSKAQDTMYFDARSEEEIIEGRMEVIGEAEGNFSTDENMYSFEHKSIENASVQASNSKGIWSGPVYFNWFGVKKGGSPEGQWWSAWQPLDGRDNWDGSVDFHKRRLLLNSYAGFNMILSQVVRNFEPAQENLFRAIKELKNPKQREKQRRFVNEYFSEAIRANSENSLEETLEVIPLDIPVNELQVPKVAPFFAAESFPVYNRVKNFHTEQDRNLFKGIVVDWFDRFFSELDQNDLVWYNGEVLAGLWYVPGAYEAPGYLLEDVEQEVRSKFGFGIYWSAHNSFSGSKPDELNYLFNGMSPAQFNKQGNVDLLLGFWIPDPNRPDVFMARAGGDAYRKGWSEVHNKTPRLVFVESAGELTESSLMEPMVCMAHYPGDGHYTGTPTLDKCKDKPCHQVSFSDVWAHDCDDPRAPFLYYDISRENNMVLFGMVAPPGDDPDEPLKPRNPVHPSPEIGPRR